MEKTSLKGKWKKYFRLGPGALVTAAFIGPGTVTTCSLAGADFGYALIWGMVFSILATIILQEMSLRLGIITGKGLGEAFRNRFSKPFSRLITIFLVVAAIAAGNAAFETGNILGASMGIGSVLGFMPERLWAVAIGLISFILLFAGSYRVIEKFLIALVILMSLTFISTAVIISPPAGEFIKGALVPSVPAGSLVTLVGLIGTTVVPYNLFLHASAVQERWKDKSDLGEARTDISVSVILGGFISIAIIVTAAVAFHGTGHSIKGASDFGLQLEPLLGSWSKYFAGAGLFAAGLSSAITAPLAAAYATAGILGWEKNIKSLRFRMIWIIILLTGLAFSLSGVKPVEAILFAQAANGILLPLIALFLLSVMNDKSQLGENINGPVSNITGIIVVLTALLLGLRSLFHVFGII